MYTPYTGEVSRAGLQRDRIVQRALEIADSDGLEAASFRRLAAEFDVTPMALYRHVADRGDLLGAMSDLVLTEIELPDDDDDGWEQALRKVLDSAVAAYTRHPAARALSSAGRWSQGSLVLTDRLIRLLTAAGFTEREGLVIVQRLSDAALAEVWALPAGQHLPGCSALDAALTQTTGSDPRMFGIDMVITGARALAAERSGAAAASDREHRSRPKS